jgi:hypothetical protein
MGLFDHVIYTAKCACCGHEITRWQTKDGPCLLMTLEPPEVKNFYATCPKCHFWNEYEVEVNTYEVHQSSSPRMQVQIAS